MATETVSKDYDALREDLKNLRADVAALAESLVASGKHRAQTARDTAVEEARRRLDEISARTHAACDRGRDAVETLERQVAHHPCKTLSMVFGAGLLMGMVMNLFFGHRRS